MTKKLLKIQYLLHLRLFLKKIQITFIEFYSLRALQQYQECAQILL